MTVSWSFSRLDALSLIQFVLLCLDGAVIWVWSLFKVFFFDLFCFFFHNGCRLLSSVYGVGFSAFYFKWSSSTERVFK